MPNAPDHEHQMTSSNAADAASRARGPAVSVKRRGRYRHAWWALYVPFYLALFAYAEHTITANYWVSYTPLDDRIPFLAPFVWFYVLWHPCLALTGIWLIVRDGDAFRRYIWSLMIGFTGSMVFCLLFPNGQNLRPAAVPGSGPDAALVRAIYSVDTNTNVLPSMHVVGTLIMLFAIFDSRSIPRAWRLPAVILGTLINLSTVFIKQHSVLDLYAGLGAGALVYVIVYIGIRRFQDSRARLAAGAGRPAERSGADQ